MISNHYSSSINSFVYIELKNTIDCLKIVFCLLFNKFQALQFRNICNTQKIIGKQNIVKDNHGGIGMFNN